MSVKAVVLPFLGWPTLIAPKNLAVESFCFGQIVNWKSIMKCCIEMDPACFRRKKVLWVRTELFSFSGVKITRRRLLPMSLSQKEIVFCYERWKPNLREPGAGSANFVHFSSDDEADMFLVDWGAAGLSETSWDPPPLIPSTDAETKERGLLSRCCVESRAIVWVPARDIEAKDAAAVIDRIILT